MKNLLLIFTLSFSVSLFSQKKITVVDSLVLKNGSVLKVGNILKLATPVNPSQYQTVFLGTFNKNTMLQFNIGMWSFMPLPYKGTEFIITELLLYKVQGKQNPIVNFADGELKGFTYIERSSVNGEITVK